MFHMKPSRELLCFTWNYKQYMRRACIYRKYIPCSTSMFHMKLLLCSHRVRTRYFIATRTNLIHDRRFHPHILLLCIYLSFAQLASNMAKRRRMAARALMYAFYNKAVWCLAPFLYILRLASTLKRLPPANARGLPVHDFIGYAQRIAYFAICFIALLSDHRTPPVHKCRPQCGGTDTEKAFSPYLYYALL